MAQVSSNDILFLKLLAEYRVLTVNQIAAVYNITPRAARKKAKTLFSEKLISVMSMNFGQGKGRPENLFKRLVLIYFKYSLKESYRDANPLQKRYAWHVSGGTIDLYHPTWISGREFSAWLKACIDAPDPKRPGEKSRIQTQVDHAFSTGAFVPYDAVQHAAHLNPDNEEPGEYRESHPATNTLARRVALKKALEIESLRPAIRALGKDAVHRLVLRILHDLADGCYHTTTIVKEFGLSKAALSRFAGVSWNRPSVTNAQTTIPDLWRNVAAVVMAEPAFLETAATAGVTRVIEMLRGSVESPGKGTNDA